MYCLYCLSNEQKSCLFADALLCCVGNMTRRSLKARQLAVAVYFLCKLSAVTPKPSPAQLWAAYSALEDYKEAASTVREEPRKFVKRWGKQFEATGSVFDRKAKRL